MENAGFLLAVRVSGKLQLNVPATGAKLLNFVCCQSIAMQLNNQRDGQTLLQDLRVTFTSQLG